MRESNSLFDEEQRAIRLTRRLQEQNDQLLEMLLAINDSTKIPPYLRYDLNEATPAESDVPALSPDQDPGSDGEGTQAYLALDEAKFELQAQTIDLATYKSLETSFLSIINRPQSLARLSKISHSVLQGSKNPVPPEALPADLTEDDPASYLSPAHEDEYCNSLDRYLNSAPPKTYPLPPPPRPTDRERERDAQLHNPMSVYNWLAKHRQEFAVDTKEEGESHNNSNNNSSNHNNHSKENKPAKGSEKKKKDSPKPAVAPSRGSKRERVSTAGREARAEIAEELDEEGFVVNVRGAAEGTPTGNGAGKGKRKRGGEDEAYRPKGGSSRPSKRKRASTLKKGVEREEGGEMES